MILFIVKIQVGVCLCIRIVCMCIRKDLGKVVLNFSRIMGFSKFSLHKKRNQCYLFLIIKERERK